MATDALDENAQQLKTAADQLGKCPSCGQKASRLAGWYPADDGSTTTAQVACDDGHQWEGQVGQKVAQRASASSSDQSTDSA